MDVQRDLVLFDYDYAIRRERTEGIVAKGLYENNLRFLITPKNIKITYEVSDLTLKYPLLTSSFYELSYDNFPLKKINDEVIIILERNLEKVYYNFKQKQKLPIFTKFFLFVISKTHNIPLYKLMPTNISYTVTYYHKFQEETITKKLSPNSFIKSVYALVPRFEKIINS